MKKIFILLLFVLSCAPSFAATMCVPDFSTCSTCTPVSYSGLTWTADCCGVRVSGIAFMIPDDSPLVSKVQDFSTLLDELPSSNYSYYYYGCQMTAPIAAPYVYINSFGMHHCTYSEFGGKKLGEICMNNFQISCAFGACQGELSQQCGYLDSGGGSD